jgi:hypothetical protein
MKCSNYLNRLNRLYKDSQTITSQVLDSKRGSLENSPSPTPDAGLLSNYGGEIIELTRNAETRAKKNALLNNKLIV